MKIVLSHVPNIRENRLHSYNPLQRREFVDFCFTLRFLPCEDVLNTQLSVFIPWNRYKGTERLKYPCHKFFTQLLALLNK